MFSLVLAILMALGAVPSDNGSGGPPARYADSGGSVSGRF